MISVLYNPNTAYGPGGSDAAGQRGDGLRDFAGTNGPPDATVPVPVTWYDGWIAISAGSSGVLALRQDGTLWSWLQRGVGLADQQLDFNGTLSI